MLFVRVGPFQGVVFGTCFVDAAMPFFRRFTGPTHRNDGLGNGWLRCLIAWLLIVFDLCHKPTRDVHINQINMRSIGR